MIVLIDVSKKGEVMHRLRGHDDEIHSLAWSPLAGEDALGSRAEDGEGSRQTAETHLVQSCILRTELGNNSECVRPKVSAGDEKGCYLASGSRDQMVRIWSSARGKSKMSLDLM